jgi:hypothetical protein
MTDCHDNVPKVFKPFNSKVVNVLNLRAHHFLVRMPVGSSSMYVFLFFDRSSMQSSERSLVWSFVCSSVCSSVWSSVWVEVLLVNQIMYQSHSMRADAMWQLL